MGHNRRMEVLNIRGMGFSVNWFSIILTTNRPSKYLEQIGSWSHQNIPLRILLFPKVGNIPISYAKYHILPSPSSQLRPHPKNWEYIYIYTCIYTYIYIYTITSQAYTNPENSSSRKQHSIFLEKQPFFFGTGSCRYIRYTNHVRLPQKSLRLSEGRRWNVLRRDLLRGWRLRGHLSSQLWSRLLRRFAHHFWGVIRICLGAAKEKGKGDRLPTKKSWLSPWTNMNKWGLTWFNHETWWFQHEKLGVYQQKGRFKH